MQIRKVLAAGAALAAATALTTLAPAQASTTTATLEVTVDGTLSITAPGTADLGSLASGATLADAPGALGTVEVSDTRTSGILNNNWVASVQSSAFTSTETATDIAATNVGYKPGTITSTDAILPVGTPAATIAVATPVVERVGVGVSTTSWNPVVTFTIGADVVAGSYTGTITHSVL